MVHVDPGQRVQASDVLLVLTNPEAERAAVDAENALRRTEAELQSLNMSLRSAELDRRAQAAAVEAEFVRATLQAEADRELFGKGLISDIQLRSSAAVAESLATQRQIEIERVEVTAESNRALLAAKQAELEQQRALFRLRAEQLDALNIRAGIDGVVQQVPVEIGQQVQSGATLALVAEPTRLQAELRVPATRARDVRPGQPVSVDTRNGIVAGTVARVDPAVQEGSVAVEVRLDSELPEGARPDMSVDGTIRNREPDQRPIRRAAGLQPGEHRHGPLPNRAGRRPRPTDPGPAGPSLRGHHRNRQWSDRGRPGRPIRHLPLGRSRPHPLALTPKRGNTMADSTTALIRMVGLKKVFLTDEVETHALSGVHLEIREGEFVAVAGPSGCGKSTLLSNMGLLDSPTEGQYLLDDHRRRTSRARTGPSAQPDHRIHLPELQPDR